MAIHLDAVGSVRAAAALVLFASGALASACVARPRMCVASAECASGSSCVAGRCQRTAGIPEVQNDTRRLVLAPVAMAYVRRGEGATGGALPPIVTLGRESDGDARLYLRFAVPFEPETRVVEAYLMLHKSRALESDGPPIALRAARVVEAWDPRSIAWPFQPKYEEARTAGAPVPSGRELVRIDVRAIVERWRQRDRRDQGIVILAERETPLGAAFAVSEASVMGDESALGAAGPRLELYVKGQVARR